MLDAIIFDLYGTLLHLRQPSRAYRMLAAVPTRLSRLKIMQRALISPSLTLTAFAEEQGITGDVVANAETVLAAELDSAEVFDDVLPCLKGLQNDGVRMGLLSNLASRYKRPFFHAGLDRFFSTLGFSCDLGVRKPDRRAFEAVLAKVGSAADNTLMVGDSASSDLKGAQNAGLKALLLDRSGQRSEFRSLSQLAEYAAEFSRKK